MKVLMPMLDSDWDRASQIAFSLSCFGGHDYEITMADMAQDSCLAADADSIVLLHGEPTVELRTFMDQAHDQAPDVPLLILDVPECGETIAAYLMAGASGCLMAGHGIDELLTALTTIQTSRPYLPPAVQAALLEQFVGLCRDYSQVFGANSTRDLGPLSSREREILQLLAQDLTNREIAEQLSLTVGTVKDHVHNILTKLDVPDRHAAADYHRDSQFFPIVTPA